MPGWIIVGVGLPVPNFRKVPCCVVIAEHDLWRQEGEEGVTTDTLDLCNQAVQARKSAFKNLVSKTHCNEWAEGDLRCKFDDVPVSAIYIALDEVITHDFST